MSQNMLGDALAMVAGPLKDLLDKLAGENGAWWLSSLKRFLRKENPFEVPMDTESQVARWREIYEREFDITLPEEIVIPDQKPGFDRLIVTKGVTLNQIIEVFRAKFKVWTYVDDLDKSVTKNERTNDETYAIWVKDLVEADPDLAKKSAKDIESENLTTETLMERLLHELAYYSETGKHLDVENITLCAGSRSSDGSVPYVSWDPGSRKLCVSWYYSVFRHSSIRARAAVS